MVQYNMNKLQLTINKFDLSVRDYNMYIILKKFLVTFRVLFPCKYQDHPTDIATSEVTLLEATAIKWVQLNELLI